MAEAKCALLVMDVQRAVVDRYPDPTYLPRLREVVAAARAVNVPVIYIVVGFRPGYPEVHRVLMDKVFPRQAEVTTVAEWVAARRNSS